MPRAGIGHPGDVLAQQIELKLPVDQRFLRAVVAYPGRSAAVIIPFLAAEKRRISVATGSAAMRADAAESALCAYLSFIALVGLVLNSVWQLHWADPAAALVIVPLIVREGRESMRGRPCGCCPSPEEENTRPSRGLQKA